MTSYAGFAVSDLAPPLSLPMGGYAARSGVASGALDALQCRAAVFRSGAGAAALLVLDVLYVARPWATDVRQRIAHALAIEPAAVLVAATHTHSGPAVFAPLSRNSELEAFEGRMAAIAVDTAVRAHAALAPCSLFLGEARAKDVGASRRQAGAEIDDRVRVAVARRADGSCLGAIAAYGCHPTVLPPANLLYSRDLFGAAVDAAGGEIGAPVLLFNGAAADVSTRFTRREPTPVEVRRLGWDLGAAIATAARSARASLSDAIAAEEKQVVVEVTALPADAEAAARVEDAVAAVEQNGERSAAERRLAMSRVEGAMAQLFLSRHGGWPAIFGSIPAAALVQRLRIGDLRVLAVPGEIFSAVGARVCAEPGRMLVGYANDYLGYLVPPERAGDGEYEAAMAMLRPESAAAIGAALEAMAHG